MLGVRPAIPREKKACFSECFKLMPASTLEEDIPRRG